MTNRRGGALLLVILAPAVLYVLFSDWTFTSMRDGFSVGSFPLAYLGLCVLFALQTLVGPAARDSLDEFRDINLPGLARIAAFFAAAVFLTFWHETYGFVLLCFLFVALISWFAGQRSIISITLYSIGVAVALYGVFTLLGFDLTIAPDAGAGVWLW